jgi:patatin-like phospholipase/acyl hydrolase
MEQLEEYLRTKNVKRIIVITGGGLRGIIPATYLQVLESASGMRVKDLVHQIDGTSTGAIVACAAERYRASELVNMFRNDGWDFFKSRCWCCTLGGLWGPRYDGDHLEYKFEEYFTNDASLSDLSYDCMIPFYDLSNRKTRFFKSHRARRSPDENYKLYTVLRCTAAAPTYFEPYELNYIHPEKDFDYTKEHDGSANTVADDELSQRSTRIENITCCDGGVTVNDATMSAFVESCEIYPDADAFCIITIDTGRYKTETIPKTLLDWGSEIPSICMNGSMDTAHHELKELGWINKKKVFAVNITTEIPEKYSAMDDFGNVEPLFNIVNSENSENIRRISEIGRLFARYPKSRATEASDFINGGSSGGSEAGDSTHQHYNNVVRI